jgi:hypothetical protein
MFRLSSSRRSWPSLHASGVGDLLGKDEAVDVDDHVLL